MRFAPLGVGGQLPMKIAMLLPGEPRFCREFDQLLSNLQTSGHSVDWFVWLWQCSPRDIRANFDVVSPWWQTAVAESIRLRMQHLLPPGHQVVNCTVNSKQDWPAPRVNNKAGETDVERAWGMYASLYQCDLARQAREAQQGPYDLVIRTRPDLGLSAPLDLAAVRALLDQTPNGVITPKNEVHGYGHRINDMFAIGSSQTMAVYAALSKYIPGYLAQGLIYHPETMLGFHLANQGLANLDMGLQVELRKTGKFLDNGGYISNYGRWA